MFSLRLTSDINYKSKDREDDNICIDLSIPHSFCVAAIWMLLDCPHESPKRWGLCQWGWVLLVEVLHGVDAGVVRDLLQPPDRPDQALRDSLCDWSIVCLFLKSHLKTCQQVRPSPSMDWGQNPLALPSPCTGDRAGPDQIGVVWQMVWMEGGQINYNLIKELRNFWPGDVGEVHGFPNTWPIFSVNIKNSKCLDFLPSFSISSALANWS